MCLNSLQFLLQKGMDSNIRDDFGQTPLHVAAFFGKIQAVEILLSYNAEKLAKTDMRRTPLELAKQKGHVEITNILSD
jgi:ankyrin repeat protein